MRPKKLTTDSDDSDSEEMGERSDKIVTRSTTTKKKKKKKRKVANANDDLVPAAKRAKLFECIDNSLQKTVVQLSLTCKSIGHHPLTKEELNRWVREKTALRDDLNERLDEVNNQLHVLGYLHSIAPSQAD